MSKLSVFYLETPGDTIPPGIQIARYNPDRSIFLGHLFSFHPIPTHDVMTPVYLSRTLFTVTSILKHEDHDDIILRRVLR